MTVTIDMQWIESDLLPNNADGINWRVLSRVKSREKRYGQLVAREVCAIGELDPIQDHALHIIYYPPRNPGPDSDNLLKALKHRLDGIAEALGINDRRFNPILITRGPVTSGGRVTVIIDDLPF